MTAADKIAEARALIEPQPAPTKLGPYHAAMQMWRDADHSSTLAVPRDAVIGIIEEYRAAKKKADLADAQAQENAKLQKVLGFYANPENWKGDEEAWERAENGDDDPETLEAMLSTVEIDGGKLARAALGETP